MTHINEILKLDVKYLTLKNLDIKYIHLDNDLDDLYQNNEVLE